MRTSKAALVLIASINIIGIICLVYFAIPFITHDTTVPNPDAMLPAQAWDTAGMALVMGLIPLVIANSLGYFVFNHKRKPLGLLWFIPSAVCLAMAISYIVLAI